MATNGSKGKVVVAVYQHNFLSSSMTFIYRQLLGVSDEFNPIVLATKRNNIERFPYPCIYERNLGILELAYARMLTRATGRVATVFKARQKYWQEILLEHGVRLVHAQFGPAGIDVLPIAKSMQLPLLVTFHGGDASRLLRNSGYVDKLQALFEYAQILTVSKAIANRLIRIGASPSRTLVHYIGAPVEDFDFVSRKPLRDKMSDGDTVDFLQVANFVEKKGHIFTLEAFRNFSKLVPNCRLVLAGSGRLRDRLERACVEMNIDSRVRFVGSVTKAEVIDLMNGADVFLHHSVTAMDGSKEGIPTVLMEAMATGLIVISTYHSGIPELVEDGHNGFLVEERDVVAYTQTLIDCVASDEQIPKRAAATINARFNLKQQNQVLKSIYRRMLDGQSIAT